MRRQFRNRRGNRGFALLALFAFLMAGVLYFVVTSLGPDFFEAYRARKTEAALAEARDALLGYAVTYRDIVDPDAVYGYLPLPDLGYNSDLTSDHNRNNNVGCNGEGCDAAQVKPTGSVASNYTVVGRFPWRVLGTEPIRDGYGECLWYVISGSHKRTQPVSPMNWDTLGQLDIVVANSTNTLGSILTSAHDRPVAIIFSPGPALPGQDRAPDGNNDVSECGGNYDAANYLDPGTAGALNDIANYFNQPPLLVNHAAWDTSTANKSLSLLGAIELKDDGTLWPNACPTGTNCERVANDLGLAITPDGLFSALRKNKSFRAEINNMLDKMTECWSWRSNIASMTPVPVTFPGAPPSDKDAGRIPDAPSSCASYIATAYGDSHVPQGYFSHYREMIFVARPTSGTFTVNGVSTCIGVLVFSGQRGSGQTRVTDATDDTKKYPANYLEPPILASFQGMGTTFSGPSELDTLASGQSAWQDIVKCIPDPSTGTPLRVTSPALTTGGYDQLVSYDTTSRTLTLGGENVTTTSGAPADALFGCAWMPEKGTRGNGFRAYFTFQFKKVGTSVGNNGFVFAAIDGESNGTNVCGAAGSHLGYSGNNGVTPRLAFPKIGIEFDQSYDPGFSESSNLAISNPGRKDPCFAKSCGGTHEANTHVAIVYWGHEAANTTDGVTRPNEDDNVHSFPKTGSESFNPRPPPQNPGGISDDTTPRGIAFRNLKGQPDDSFLYHVRVEVTPTRNANSSAAEQSSTTLFTKAWIIRDSATNAQIIAAMQNTARPMVQLSPGTAATLADTATVYDVAGDSCNGDGKCLANGYTCGTDKICYRPGMKSIRLGFTGSQRTQDQQVIISNFFASWLQ
jgi:hypothetical protein